MRGKHGLRDVDEAMDAGLDGSEPFVLNLKMLRAELLSVKGDISSASSRRSAMYAAFLSERVNLENYDVVPRAQIDNAWQSWRSEKIS